MLLARQYKENNLAEYILYMWQLEDMFRAFGLDMQRIDESVVSRFDVDPEKRKEIHDWYENLVEMMKNEKIEKSGHLQVVKNSVNELTDMHFYLLHTVHDPQYHQLVTMALHNFIDFRKHAGVADEVSDVELALNALYGTLMLRLKGEQIGEETVRAMESFSKVIGYLAAKYKQMEEDERKDR
ncbi:MAG: DUF4924 family protein [Marinifilaceae bacterium]